MVEIFKTNIEKTQDAHTVILQLLQYFPEAKIKNQPFKTIYHETILD